MKTYKQFKNSNYTCIIKDGNDIVFTSEAKGVKPLLDFLKVDYAVSQKLVLFDKVIGKGAMLLAIKAGVKEIHTPLVSKPALELASHYQIKIDYEKQVDYIINRTKNGMCPIESSVLEIDDIETGYKKIIQTFEALKNK
jgi:hypothetical protein